MGTIQSTPVPLSAEQQKTLVNRLQPELTNIADRVRKGSEAQFGSPIEGVSGGIIYTLLEEADGSAHLSAMRPENSHYGTFAASRDSHGHWEPISGTSLCLGAPFDDGFRYED